MDELTEELSPKDLLNLAVAVLAAVTKQLDAERLHRDLNEQADRLDLEYPGAAHGALLRLLAANWFKAPPKQI